MDPFQVTVHAYPSTTNSTTHAYEYLSCESLSESPRNALVFIGGLGDGPHGVPYVRNLASKLAGGWSLFEIRLRSAYSAFGLGSLEGDVRDLRALVRYLRGHLGRKRVVLMGHSTGCQDCLAYSHFLYSQCHGGGDDMREGVNTRTKNGEGTGTTKGVGPESGDRNRTGGDEAQVDGYILQGPVSDREAIAMGMPADEMQRAVDWASERIREGKGKEVMMPHEWMPEGFRDGPVTAYRWFSLAGVGGDDDFFSSDLSNEKITDIWARIQQPVLILPSGEDQYVPREIDVPGLVDKWKRACKPSIASELSGLIPGADHAVRDPLAQEWLVDRVIRFLKGLETS